jgi:4-nitrophenyl phosphatase
VGSIKAAAFDLDGTIYTGNRLVDGVIDVLHYLMGKGIKIFYFTNNSSRTRKDIHQKLHKLGLNPDIETVYNSAYATGIYLKTNKYKKIYCCGSTGLKDEIALSDIKCVSDKEFPEAVVVGLDVEFNYEKMSVALHLLRDRKCRFIICNRDRTYPVEDNLLMPGCGAIVAALEYAVKRSADVITGKPNTYMLELLCKDWKLVNHEILIVGDSYESDIAMAKNFGSPSVLINPSGKKANGTVSIKKISDLVNYSGIE